MRAALSAATTGHRPPQPPMSGAPIYPPSPHSTPPVDDQAAWAREEQQMMIRQQDETMDSISGTLDTIAQQASLMGQEIGEHNEYVVRYPGYLYFK